MHAVLCQGEVHEALNDRVRERGEVKGKGNLGWAVLHSVL